MAAKHPVPAEIPYVRTLTTLQPSAMRTIIKASEAAMHMLVGRTHNVLSSCTFFC